MDIRGRRASVAEGIETPEEARACCEVGFHLAQGYHFGHPQPVETLGVELSIEAASV